MLNVLFKFTHLSLVKTIHLVQHAHFATGETGGQVKHSRHSRGSHGTEAGSPELPMPAHCPVFLRVRSSRGCCGGGGYWWGRAPVSLGTTRLGSCAAMASTRPLRALKVFPRERGDLVPGLWCRGWSETGTLSSRPIATNKESRPRPVTDGFQAPLEGPRRAP